MPGPLDGIRVIEVASWMFIPSGGSVLVDWGADVIKIEGQRGSVALPHHLRAVASRAPGA